MPIPDCLTTITAGTTGHVHFVYGDFPCTVLAVLGPTALVEYTREKGTTALAFVAIDDPGSPWTPLKVRPCTYRQLLKPWLVAVVQQSGSWLGRSMGGQVEQPAALLAERFVLKEGIGV